MVLVLLLIGRESGASSPSAVMQNQSKCELLSIIKLEPVYNHYDYDCWLF